MTLLMQINFPLSVLSVSSVVNPHQQLPLPNDSQTTIHLKLNP